MTIPPTKKSDLGVRTASAVAMLAVAGTALWLGGGVWAVFVAAVALGVLWEWWRLTLRFGISQLAIAAWVLGGVIYIGLAGLALLGVRGVGPVGFNGDIPSDGCPPPYAYHLVDTATILGLIIAVDIGAYFFGRTLGGPKIAPKISPAKTWSGLIGGTLGASAVFCVREYADGSIGQSFRYSDICPVLPFELSSTVPYALVFGALIAIIAQAGDFFESWMKRRAGVKDSGSLIPGHGGLFDRVDGLLAVCFVLGIAMLASRGLG